MSRLTKINRRLLKEEALFYIKDITSSLGKEKYFPTNLLKDIASKKYNTIHCWNTYKRMLQRLENEGIVESVDTKVGKMWRLKR